MAATTSQDMKNSQMNENDQIDQIDQIEDLTLFADESFDTGDIDLFEFTGEDDSPLTRLKSIILSLDWEINDDILQELSNEVDYLQQQWVEDKVAGLYLQGLGKIGGYLRTKGAYAHPNSIKLLLTFFYNFEKIISSQNISGSEISALLKGDIRKFKILQYQIGQAEAPKEELIDETIALTPEGATAGNEIFLQADKLKLLKASILSLDWEVTDESLKQFNTQLEYFHDQLRDNKAPLVLVQGLQALGGYIAEEKASAHPDSFTLVDLFYDALETFMKKGDELNAKQAENILVDRISRLNNLKAIIAGHDPSTLPTATVDKVVDQIFEPDLFEGIDEDEFPVDEDGPTPALADAPRDRDISPEVEDAAQDETDTLESSLDSFFGLEPKAAMETADNKYPDEILPPEAIHPVDDEVADDFIEEQLSDRGYAPALSGFSEDSDFNKQSEYADAPIEGDLEQQLSLLFDKHDEDADELPVTADEESDIEFVESTEILQFDESTEISQFDESAEPVSALSDVEAPEGEGMPAAEDETPIELTDKLDNFFAGEIPDEPESETVTEPESEIITLAENDADIPLLSDTGLAPALADSDEEQGFSEADTVAQLNDSPLDDIEEKLDFFFTAEDEEESVIPADASESEDSESDFVESLDLFASDNEEEEKEIAPALADFTAIDEDDKDGLPGDSDGDERIEENLSLFFDEDEEKEDTPALADFTAIDEDEKEGLPGDSDGDERIEEDLSLFFDEDEEKEDTPAVEALTQAIEDNIGEAAPEAFFEEETPVASLAERDMGGLLALGALLPGLIRTPTDKDAREAAGLIAEIKDSSQHSPEQTVVLQLIDSVLTQVQNDKGLGDVKAENLVNHLYEASISDRLSSASLPKLIAQYTSWVSSTMEIMTTKSQMAGEVRATLKEEFETLRKELRQGE